MFSLEKEDVAHPINFKTIMQYQQNNKSLIAESNKDYSIKYFHGIEEKYSVICSKYIILIPILLAKQVVEWYHNG